MKILLVAINAKYIHSNPAVYSLRAYAGGFREYIEIAEYTINMRTEHILADIFGKQPDVIAFSCYIWNISVIEDLITELLKVMPHTPVWVGGPEVTYDGEAFLNTYPQVTGVIAGEGESAFLELVRSYVEGNPCRNSIKGIITRKGIYQQGVLTELDRIPFFYENMTDFSNRIVYYESSRGCPYACTYCLSSIDKTVRFRSLALVERELKFFLDQNVALVKFVDRTFNCSHIHAMGIWKFLKENDNGVTRFHFEISADILNEEELQLLYTLRPGQIQLEIGVQSTNPATICEINRTMEFEKLSEIVKCIQSRNNIHQHLDLIAGLPHEDYDRFVTSFNDVYSLKPEQLQLGFLKVLKGSPMHSRAEEYGLVYAGKPPYEVLYTKWISYQQILQLKAVEEMVELYYNSKQFTNTIKLLEQVFISPFELYKCLADYYKKMGYEIMNPSRMRRYEILLGFAEEYDNLHNELYQEVLVLDLYLRENLKNRPYFAKDLTSYKETVKEFYHSEEQNKKYLSHYQGCEPRQLSRMTHIEVFHYNVMKPEEFLGEMRSVTRGEYFVLFDYKKHNPLSCEAAVSALPLQVNRMN